MTDPASVRTVVVASPSGRRETLGVVRAAAVVVVVWIFVAGLQRGSAGVDQPLGTYQVLFRDQPEDVQRMYRELSTGLEDAIRMRTPSGEWPSIEELRKDFVGPFAGSGKLTWELRKKGALINYLGHPASGPPGRTWLLLLQENVSHPETAALDEFHRKLPNGTLLHVGIWNHTDPRIGSDPLWMPEREGWTEVVLGSARRDF